MREWPGCWAGGICRWTRQWRSGCCRRVRRSSTYALPRSSRNGTCPARSTSHWKTWQTIWTGYLAARCCCTARAACAATWRRACCRARGGRTCTIWDRSNVPRYRGVELAGERSRRRVRRYRRSRRPERIDLAHSAVARYGVTPGTMTSLLTTNLRSSVTSTYQAVTVAGGASPTSVWSWISSGRDVHSRVGFSGCGPVV